MCLKCSKEKAHTEFGRDCSRPDGRYPYCKQCRTIVDPIFIENESLFNSGKKRCTKCSEIKPLNAFDVDTTKRYGRTSSCKKCGLSFRRIKYSKYHDKIKELEALFSLGLSRCNQCDGIKPLDDFLKSKRSKYKIYRTCKICNNGYRRRRLPSRRDYTRWEVFADDDYLCYLCEEPMDMDATWPDPGSPTIDHVVPICRDGVDSRSNVRSACWRCNLEKKDKDLQEFLDLRSTV